MIVESIWTMHFEFKTQPNLTMPNKHSAESLSTRQLKPYRSFNPDASFSLVGEFCILLFIISV
jgi:hypothetical protein